jgi:hypothetical protein
MEDEAPDTAGARESGHIRARRQTIMGEEIRVSRGAGPKLQKFFDY